MPTQLPLGIPFEWSPETSMILLTCIQGDREVRIQVVQDKDEKKDLKSKFQIDGPLGQPLFLNVFSGYFLAQSEELNLEIGIRGQRLLLKSPGYVLFSMNSSDDVLNLVVQKGNIDLARAQQQVTVSGMAQVIQISTIGSATTSWNGQQILSSGQKTVIFPSGIVTPKSQAKGHEGMDASGVKAMKVSN
jgi:hypothetical protein